MDNLDKIRALLDTSADYILRGANTASQTYMHREILDMLEGCSPEKIKLIASVIKPIIEYKE